MRLRLLKHGWRFLAEMVLCLIAAPSMVSASTDGILFFPHFVSGGGVAGEIILLNQDGAEVSGNIEFFDSNGTPVEVASGNQLLSRAPFEIPPQGAFRLTLSEWGVLKTGYVKVVPELGVRHLSGSIVFSIGGTRVSVPPTPPSRSWSVAVDEGPGVRTGVALANPESYPVVINLKLVDAKGAEVKSRQLTLAANSKVAEFVSEMFEPAVPFTLGSVTASAASVFAGLSLRQGKSGDLSVIGWGDAAQGKGIGTFGQVQLDPEQVLKGAGENVDSVAFWDAPNPVNSMLFVTGKANRLVEVWKFPFAGNQQAPLSAPFGSGMVNGVAVDQHLDLLFVSQARPSSKVFVFQLPGLKLVKTFSNLPLGDEPNLATFVTPSFDHLLYVTDDHFVYGVDIGSGNVLHKFRPPLAEIETVLGDSVAGVIHVPDEDGRTGIYAFKPDGTPVERCQGGNCSNRYGEGVFSKDAEGIILYQCPSVGVGDDGTGFIVVSDQRLSGTQFEVFDRESWDHLGSFKIKGVSNTDGIASTQRPMPGFPMGVFAAVNDDTSTALVGWDRILSATGLSCQKRP